MPLRENTYGSQLLDHLDLALSKLSASHAAIFAANLAPLTLAIARCRLTAGHRGLSSTRPDLLQVVAYFLSRRVIGYIAHVALHDSLFKRIASKTRDYILWQVTTPTRRREHAA